MATIAARLKSVSESITKLCSSLSRKEPTLVAVSKTKPNEALQEAYDAGQRHFGENYVQEIIDKAPAMPADIKWHFIGHLQSNKAKVLVNKVPNLYVVETVDTSKLADKLNKACENAGRDPLLVFMQVNTSEESQKSGCAVEDAPALAKHIAGCSHLVLKGLMTIGKLDGDASEDFKTLVKCRATVAEALGKKEEELELSMGMSGDYEKAIELGSTNVRVGSTIFGAREYKK